MKRIISKLALLITGYVIIKLFLLSLSNLQATLFLQEALARLICLLQNSLGVECSANGINIYYSGVTAQIQMWCLGLDHILYLSLLLFVFFEKNAKKPVFYGLIIMIIINLLRILLFGIISYYFGVFYAIAFHHAWYFYGQTTLMLFTFVLLSIYFQRLWPVKPQAQ